MLNLSKLTGLHLAGMHSLQIIDLYVIFKTYIQPVYKVFLKNILGTKKWQSIFFKNNQTGSYKPKLPALMEKMVPDISSHF